MKEKRFFKDKVGLNLLVGKKKKKKEKLKWGDTRERSHGIRT